MLTTYLHITKKALLAIGVMLFVTIGFSAPLFAAPKCSDNQQEITISLDGTTHCIDKNSDKANSAILQKNPIYVWLIAILKFLSVGVGLAVTCGIIWGGLVYMTARGNASQ